MLLSEINRMRMMNAVLT